VTALLEVDGLTGGYDGVPVLHGVDLTVRAGTICAVLGANGAGKTTLFNVICGFVRPGHGTMTWAGAELRPRPEHLSGLGIARTLQGIGLFAGLSVLENVMVGAASGRARFGSALLALPGSDRAERALRQAALDCLRELGVAGYADRSPDSLPSRSMPESL